MMPISRRKGMAFIWLMSLWIGLSGCMNLGEDRQYMESSQPPPLNLGSSGYSGNLTSSGKPNMLQQTGHLGSGHPFLMQAQGTKPEDALGDPQMLENPAGMAPPPGAVPPTGLPLPTELARTVHAPHRVAPPDILYLEALRLVPRGPYKLSPMEVLQIEVPDSLPKQEIRGLYMITPEGNINLGHTYGSVRVSGLTVEQAQAAIRNQLNNIIKNASVNVAVAQMRGMQNVKGEHVVRPDGTISLGMYGSVFVAGMTVGQVKCQVENHLAAYLVDPQVAVDVFAYNSRKIFIIADGAGYGQQVIAIPATGGETVLDAVSRVQGLPPVASLKKIWVARPSPVGNPCSQVLPVDWKAITQAGRTETNYQLFPGDRIYISADPLITAYNYLDKMIAPIERVLGVTWLGANLYQTLRNGTGATGAVVVR